jgi:hypothetical protein
MATKKTTTDLVEQAPKGLFNARMASKDVPFEQGEEQVIFTVQQLSSDKMTYANSQAANPETGMIDQGMLMWWTVKLGICGIKNFKDQTGSIVPADFEQVSIFTKNNVVDILSDEMMKGIPYHVLTALYPVIQMITFMSAEEVEKLDFFTQPEELNVTKTPRRRSKKAGSPEPETSDEVLVEQK